MTKTKKALTAITAAAQRLVASPRSTTRKGGRTSASWTDECWRMYDEVGELHFLNSMIAGRVGQAALFVGAKGDGPGREPDKLEEADHPAVEALEALGNSAAGLTSLLTRVAANLGVAGAAYIVGLPRWMVDPEAARPVDGVLDITDLVWQGLSGSEVRASTKGTGYDIDFQGSEFSGVTEDEAVIVRVWQPHPKTWSEPDSAVRSALPILRKIVGFNQYVSAQLDSALAGAGILLLKQNVKDGVGGDDDDQLVLDLIDYSQAPLDDRAAAASLTPYILGVPSDVDDVNKVVKHITFSSPLDATVPQSREEAIRALAIALDAPPEILLGQGSANHWSAWLIEEETVSSHIEPVLALICEALTEQYLRPVLEAAGYVEEDVAKLSVWYDVTDLIERPDRMDDATKVYDRGELSPEALRTAAGFSDSDAPEDISNASLAVELAARMIAASPDLIVNPGWEPLVEELTALFDHAPVPNRPGLDAVERATVGRSAAAPVASSADGPPEARP